MRELNQLQEIDKVLERKRKRMDNGGHFDYDLLKGTARQMDRPKKK